MLALVLAAALIAQVAQGAPTNCGEFCDQSIGSYPVSQSWGSHSSYSKQSRYGSHQSYSSGSRGLGSAGSNLETLDENAVIGTAGLDRPGTWQDAKHYVTDDGKGEMNYRAGQTVTNNGFSKYASHSYRYGSHDSHAPLSNSQILSTSEFNSELQNIRSRIASFMGSFNLGSGSLVNANTLEDFKHNANLITTQFNDVCGQLDVNSSMYQQMQQELQQFLRQSEERQRQMEATIFQTTSSTSTATHGSINRYPGNNRPAPVVQVRPDENAIFIQQQQQRLEEEIAQVQSQINAFYSTFNRIDNDVKFEENLNTEVNVITQKLIELNLQSEQNNSQRQRIENMKNRYEAYVSSIRARIEEQERRNQEEEVKRQQRLQEIENERIRLENAEQAKQAQARLETERLRQQEQEAERQRIATEKRRQEEEAESRRQLQVLENERARIRNERINAEERRRQNEKLQIDLDQQQQQLHQLQQTVQTTRPQATGSVQVSGTSSVHHSVSGSYGNTGSIGTTGSYGSTGSNGAAGSYIRPQSVIPQQHIDLTAAVNRLQQDFNRIQNEVNKFNTYSMRLTADNKISIVSEARQRYDQLRQNLENICNQSSRYNNQNLLSSAQELKRHFESLYKKFKDEADRTISSDSQVSVSGEYTSSGSYGASGSRHVVHQPKVSNVEYTHEKSTEVEIGSSRGPVQHYASGSGYGQSSGYKSYGASADDIYRTGAIDLGGGGYSSSVDCVEQQAGQPCILPPRRNRRSVGDYGPIFDQPEDYSQKYVLPSLDDYQNTGRVELPRDHQPIRNSQYNRQNGSRVADLTRQQGDVDDYYYRRGQPESEDLNQQHVNYGQNEDLDSLQRPRSEDVDVFGHRTPGRGQSGSAHQTGEFTLEKSGFNDYNKPTEISNLNIFTTTPRSAYGHSQHESDGLTLQNSGFNDYPTGSTENPRRVKPIRNYGQSGSQDFTLENSGFNDGVRPLASGNLQLNQQTEDVTQQQNNFAGSAVRNQRLERLDDFGVGDLTQQTASQIDFGPESQVGRGFSSQDASKPERYSSHNQNNSQQSQSLQGRRRNEHPTGQYVENLSQQHQQPFDNTQELGSGQSGRYIESANSQTERSYTSTENQGYISTIRPTVRPAPKPVPRYSRPWQVNNIDNRPKQVENEQRFSENQNTGIEQSSTPKSVKPLSRGDLPGQSEPTTSESTTPSFYDNIPVTTERPSITPKPYDDFGFGQHDEKVDLKINNESYGQQNNQFGQSGGAYHFNQHHSFRHNFSYTQNSNYFNQQGSNIDLGQTIQNPSSQLETQSQTNGYGQDQQSTYKFHEGQLRHSRFEHTSSSNYDFKPINFENLQSTSQSVFNQQTQFPSFEQSGQYGFEQQETNQRSEDLLAAGVIPLDERRPLDTWQENTTPPTFWKKIGQKLSHSYDKAKEKAKNIFG